MKISKLASTALAVSVLLPQAVLADCTLPKTAAQTPASIHERAVTAVQMKDASDGVFVSWRLLKKDTSKTTFDVWRQENNKTRKLTPKPIEKSTNFIDPVNCNETDCSGYRWFVKVLYDKKVQACTPSAALPEGDRTVLSISNGANGFGRNVAFGELNGKAGLDYVLRFPDSTIDPFYKLWRPSTTTFKLHGFDSEGALLWRYDMGHAIEGGMWYSPFLVYDLDNDGIAEIIVKSGDENIEKKAVADTTGRVTKGNEYLKIVSGKDGKTVLARAPWPDRSGFTESSGEAYSKYNRYSRHQLAIAYLDGKNPHVIVERGTYGRQKVHAFRFSKTEGLQPVWQWENHNPRDLQACAPDYVIEDLKKRWGQGAHTIRTGDVDGDGRDEVIIGSLTIDHDGSTLWTIGRGDLDHIYLGELDPRVPGLEMYYGSERGHDAGGMGMVKAKTGEYLWKYEGKTKHIHKEGMCADVYSRYPGVECYSGEADSPDRWMWTSDGQLIEQDRLKGLTHFSAYWGPTAKKLWIHGTNDTSGAVAEDLIDLESGEIVDQVLYPKTTAANDRQYRKIVAIADLVGDWREEIVTVDRGSLIINMSTMYTTQRRPWLMTDHTYHMGAILGSMGYYQPPLLGYDPSR